MNWKNAIAIVEACEVVDLGSIEEKPSQRRGARVSTDT